MNIPAERQKRLYRGSEHPALARFENGDPKPSRKKWFIHTHNDNADPRIVPKWIEIKGERFEYPGLEHRELFLHRRIAPLTGTSGEYKFVISDAVTGAWIGKGRTKEETCRNAEERLDAVKKRWDGRIDEAFMFARDLILGPSGFLYGRTLSPRYRNPAPRRKDGMP